MKNKKTLACLILLITSIVISCSWQIPEKVTVTTKADYEFGLGQVSMDLSEQLDIPKMIEKQGTQLPLGMSITDYWPEKKDANTQRYLIRVPIVEFPLNIEQYLEKLNMVSSFDAIKIENVKFTVPDIKIDPMKIDIPVADVIPFINQGLTGGGFVNKGQSPLYPADILETAGISIGKVYYDSLILEIKGQDIENMVGDLGTKLPQPPEGAGYEFSPTIADNRKVTINFGPNDEGKEQIYSSYVKNNVARFELNNIVIDTNKTTIQFDSDPVIKLVSGNRALSRGGFGNIPIPDVNLDNIKIPDNIKNIIETAPTPDKIQQDILSGKVPDNVEGIKPGMTTEEMQNVVANKKPVVVIEGYLATVDPSSKLKSVKGLTLLDISDPEKKPRYIEATIPEQKIPNMLKDEYGVVRAKVGEGKIDIKIDGFTADYKMSVTSKGGLDIPTKEITKANSVLSLNDISIVKGDSVISGSASFALNKTDIIFNPAPKLVLTPALTSIASVTADINAFGDIGKQLKITKSFELPSELTKLVSKIDLNESGVKITYTNTLPQGNDIKFKAKSDFLNIDRVDNPVVIEAGAGKDAPGVAELYTKGEINIGSMTNPAVDFDVEVILPKEPGDPDNYVTAKNVKAGDTYSIEFNLEPKVDWKSISVKTSNIEIPNEAINTNISLYDQLKGVAEQIGQPDLFKRLALPDLPIYIFCTKPKIEALDAMKIKAKANLYFGKDGTTVPSEAEGGYIIGGPETLNDSSKNIIGGYQEINFVNEVPNFKTEENKNTKSKYIVEDLSLLGKDKVSLVPDPENLSKLISNILSTPGNLCLGYDVKIDGKENGEDVVITKNMLMNSEDSTIKLEACIDLGLAFKLAGIEVDGKETEVGMSIDILKLTGMGEQLKDDLLNGMIGQFKEQGIDQVLGLIKEVSIDYNLFALPIALPAGKDLTVNIELDPGVVKDNIGLSSGKIGITKTDLETIFNDPSEKLILKKIDVNVPSGYFSIKRNKNAAVGVNVNFATDGSLKIMENGKVVIGKGSQNVGGAK